MSAQTVLFDAPGPKARRRHAILAVARRARRCSRRLWLVMRKMARPTSSQGYMWAPSSRTRRSGRNTCSPACGTRSRRAILSVIFAVVFGLVFGIGRLSPLRAVRWVVRRVVEFFRSVPVLLMMIFFFFGWFSRIDWFPTELAPARRRW